MSVLVDYQKVATYAVPSALPNLPQGREGQFSWRSTRASKQDRESLDGPLFRPMVNNRTGTLDQHLDPGSVYRNIVIKYAKATGVSAEASGFVSIRCARRRRPMRSHTRRTSPRCRNGLGTPMFPLRVFMIGLDEAGRQPHTQRKVLRLSQWLKDSVEIDLLSERAKRLASQPRV